MKIIELIINETEGLMGVEAMSVVQHPAIESNFITLKKDLRLMKDYKTELKVDEEKRLLMGPALIPNKLIYRNDDNGEYYIYFTAETVRKASQLFFQASKQNNATREHEKVIEGMTVVESWVKEDMDRDKSAIYELKDPVETWMISMKCDNDEVWNDAKEGKLKGFSIEAYFADKYQAPSEQGLIEQIKKILEE